MGLVIATRLIVAYLLGLAAPGIPLALYLGVRPFWCGAFTLSWLSLVIGVITFQMLGIPITWAGLCVWQVAVMVIAGLALRYGGRRQASNDSTSGSGSILSPMQRRILLATIGTMACVMAVRVAISPLTGFDTIFRWEFLAKQMLVEGNLDFYPPMTAKDYEIYVFPDGIAPVVSAVYWWLYAAWGRPEPVVTSAFVFMQWAVVIGFTWQLARNLAGPMAGWIAASTIAGSTFLVRQVGIGQEAGALTISLVGMMSVLAAAAPNDYRMACAAGLLAGMGALSREYGGVFLVAAMFMQGWRWRGKKVLLTFVGVAALTASPWYIRNIILCGSPFHSLNFPGFSPASPVLAGMLETYKSIFSPELLSWSTWQSTGLDCLFAMPLVLTVGVAASVVFVRRFGFIPLTVALMAVVWHHSIGYTAGGLNFSLRVLTPAVALVSVSIGMLGAWFATDLARAWGVTIVLVLAGLWGIAMSASFPFNLPPSQFKDLPQAFFAPYPQGFAEQSLAQLVGTLEPANSRILTESAYGLCVMVEAGHPGVPLWSPEVSYLFDGVTSSEQCARKLRESGIRYLLFFPTSPDNQFFMKHAFFKDGLQLKVVSDHKVFALCKLPE